MEQFIEVCRQPLTRVKLAIKATRTEIIKKLRQNAFEELEEY